MINLIYFTFKLYVHLVFPPIRPGIRFPGQILPGSFIKREQTDTTTNNQIDQYSIPDHHQLLPFYDVS